MKRSPPTHWLEESQIPNADAPAGSPAKKAHLKEALKRLIDAGSTNDGPAPKVSRNGAAHVSGGIEVTATGGSELSESNTANLREIFAMFDRDGDGEISPDELDFMMQALGENLSLAEIEEIIAEAIITNGNGTIDFPEFVAITSDPILTMSEEEGIRETFRVFDRDGKGFINATDVRHIMTVLGQQLTDKEVFEMMHEANFDVDGQISYEEFVALITST
ncbi:neo-calmodulin-like [Rhipicephalus microplus]|uniref:neo-calmodulin-like n=1 Tax=Rhipicephalus microplus TaxID=6941 RepID=UPI003F6D7518